LLDAWDGSSEGNTFKLKSGDSEIIRLRPRYPKSAQEEATKKGVLFDYKMGIMVMKQHGWLPRIDSDAVNNQGERRGGSYFCMRQLGKPCGFCNFIEKLPEADKDIRKEYGVSNKTILDVYVKSTGSWKRWYTSKTNLETLITLFELVPTVNHPTKGKWLKIKRTGSGMFDTKYTIIPAKYKKPFEAEEDEYPDLIKGVLGDLRKAGPKSCRKVLKLAFGTCDPMKKKIDKQNQKTDKKG